MNEVYIIPANTKRSQLIFSIFRGIDLIIFASGAGLTLLLLMLLTETSLVTTVIKLAPVSVCAFLVMPFPNYHNVLTFITEVYNFYSNRKVYIWRGWCISDDSK
jgi:hypothetical protein